MYCCLWRARISVALKITLTCFVEISLINITALFKMSHASRFTNRWCTIIAHHCHYCLIMVEGVVIYLTVIYNWCRPAGTTRQPLRVLGMAQTEPGPASSHACLRCACASFQYITWSCLLCGAMRYRMRLPLFHPSQSQGFCAMHVFSCLLCCHICSDVMLPFSSCWRSQLACPATVFSKVELINGSPDAMAALQ